MTCTLPEHPNSLIVNLLPEEILFAILFQQIHLYTCMAIFLGSGCATNNHKR
jgi:hypothetical protein